MKGLQQRPACVAHFYWLSSCWEEVLLFWGLWLHLPPFGRFWLPQDRWEERPPLLDPTAAMEK